MAIALDHTIVPARDKDAAAKHFAELFGLTCMTVGPFAAVPVNETFSMDFDDRREDFDVHHYAFHVSDAEFDAIFGRVKAAGKTYGSAPWTSEDMKVGEQAGGRVVYFREYSNHLLEIRTVASQVAIQRMTRG